ncbi:MBL fold metallo-hydrolase [Sphingomonas ginkgonis]|uniref:MBL fold metallo-hydrolase n=1 Tax=Sphingomonas ginkgonis TaxID=2315330 RepID=A0A3R9WRV3_9SPHN|nr:MBL fold metallo-hydrolase [Sphingomonas ginkgonis]RST30301.1 MBL fold metallo-hydrolase [Sphingomonas ginkgonis]
MNAPYAELIEQEPGIGRVLAPNPSAFTGTGTQTHLLGTAELAVIDPGPDEAAHVEALLAAIAGRPVRAILVTHTHRDHSPAARALAAATGAPVMGCAPLPVTSGSGLEASFDTGYSPDRVLGDGETIELDGAPLEAVFTPGHTSNHLCFGWRGALFSGDHVMGWSTTVIIPPDGNMGDYMRSLDKLRHRRDRIYYPAHGDPVTRPQQLLRGMIGHRLQRERQILRLVGTSAMTVEEIVPAAYPGLDPRLTRAAGASVLAHLLDLETRGLVERAEGQQWSKAA